MASSTVKTGRGVACRVLDVAINGSIAIENLISIDIYGDILSLKFQIGENCDGQRLVSGALPTRHVIEIDFSGAGLEMSLEIKAAFDRVSHLKVGIDDAVEVGVDLRIVDAVFKFHGGIAQG